MIEIKKEGIVLSRSQLKLERNNDPAVVPEFDYESHGVEDSRIAAASLNLNDLLEKLMNYTEV